MKKIHRRTKQIKNGFTLIELLVVIGIVGIIAGNVFVTNIITYLQKARDTERKADIASIRVALEQYKSENQKYPISQDGNAFLNNTPCNNSFTSDDGVIYIKKTPCDPLGSKTDFNTGNYYYFSPDGEFYIMAGCLEYKKDAEGNAMKPVDYFNSLYH